MATYDLTGTNPFFLSTGNRFAAFEIPFKVEFGRPVFLESLSAHRATPDLLSWDPEPQGGNWVINPDDIDQTAMSLGILMDETFNKTLVKSVTIVGSQVETRHWLFEYQEFVKPIEESELGNKGPDPTPGLMKDMIEKIDFLMLVKDPIRSITADILNGVQILPEDVTGLAVENFIEDERHAANVPAGKAVIIPGAGSYFEHDVVLTNVANDSALVRDVDYEFVAINKPKTRVAEHTSGVFDYILLLKPFVGDIDVTYHAFGGEVTVHDMRAMKDIISDVIMRLREGNYLTNDSLQATQTIIQILERLSTVEDHVSHYVVAEHRFEAATDGKHWLSIGELYRDQWSPAILSTSHTHLTIQSETQGWVYDANLSINIDRLHEKLRIDVNSSLDRFGHFSLGEYADFTNRRIPEMRVVWNKNNAGTLSGLVLQIGLHMTANQVESVSVWDKSGNASALELYPNKLGTVNAIDNDIPLPDGQIWNPNSGVSHEEHAVLCPSEGYLVWGGGISMNEIHHSPTPFEHLIVLDDVAISSIKKLTFTVYDRIDDRFIVTTQEHRYDDRELISDNKLFFAEDLCAIKYEFRVVGGKIVMILSSTMGSHSVNNERFDLRQIVLFT